jgi:DNA-directed RNA polymerase specialized sigma24 family protein
MLAPAVREAVEKLPSIQRIVVQGIFFERRSAQSVADQLGAHVAFVRRILAVALTTLRKEMGSIEESNGRPQ